MAGLFTPAIFDAIEQVQPGVGGEIQLTDAIGLLLKDEPVKGQIFVEGRFDIGNKIEYLRATVELALERDDLGPEFRLRAQRDHQAPRHRLTSRRSAAA